MAAAFGLKAKTVNSKYIAPPKSTDLQLFTFQLKDCSQNFQVIESKDKRTFLQELRTKYKVTVSGPNTLSALLQSYYLDY